MNATLRAAILIIFGVACALAWTLVSLQPIPGNVKETILTILGILVIISITWAIVEIVIITREK